MKKILFKTFSFVNKLYLLLSLRKQCFHGGLVFRVAATCPDSSSIDLRDSDTFKTTINIEGNKNTVSGENAYIADTLITISGNNNRLLLGNGVKLRRANVIIRGNGCTVQIGERTTFGGVRIVNVGSGNIVDIGEDSLFADQIEIWASDTHSIYDEHGKWINPEKPVKVGNRVWVGSKVTILKGVTINDGAVIGMGSMVTKDVPAKVICAGSPLKILKENVTWHLDYNFSDQQIY